MRDMFIAALRSHAEGHIQKHLANVEVYLENPAGIGEHPDVFEAVESELMEVAKYHDVLEMIETYIEK